MIHRVRALPAAILGMAALLVVLALAVGLSACGPGKTTTV